MNRVVQRLKDLDTASMKKIAKKHLLQVFLAALYYDSSATIKYMEMKRILKEVIVELCQIKRKFKT